jgi:GTPase
MCKEHLGVALALKVPVFFVVTKVDICPGHVLQHSLATLSSILRKPGVKKKPFMVSLNLCTKLNNPPVMHICMPRRLFLLLLRS